MEVSVPIPIDDEGFLMRQCDACSRRFKWLPEDDAEPPLDGLYGCPYCRARRDSDAWFTDEQVEYLEWHGGQAALSELSEAGFRVEAAPAPAPPDDDPTMVRVDFLCHPDEPAKVYPEWPGNQPVFCLICGDPA